MMKIITVSRCLSWGFIKEKNCYFGRFHFKGHYLGKQIHFMELYTQKIAESLEAGEEYLLQIVIKHPIINGTLIGKVEISQKVDEATNLQWYASKCHHQNILDQESGFKEKRYEHQSHQSGYSFDQRLHS